ncbi:MAG TPA: CRISPR-associated endonuclease Cas3'' [Fimbriimonadaceae bacterium]|nr:CRISPR-associated endonuclease Cas3'' [Fimbriimonadaceae bacterium]HRJ97907.1 CRISPR-associated endonuclease Cas3'' [Fimbriimonadaceae bacterium]
MSSVAYLNAHTPPSGSDRWHGLVEHLQAVAASASRFGAKFGQADLAHALGLTHDLAKADPRFQRYLQECKEAGQNGSGVTS